MEMLGYRAKHGLLTSTEELCHYDFFFDAPNEDRYTIFNMLYCDAKFILTVRDVEEWIGSYKRRLAKVDDSDGLVDHQSITIYNSGYPPSEWWRYWTWVPWDEALFRMGFQVYTARVKEYFSKTPEALLIMNICKGEGWEKLCPFLGKDIPEEPFPWFHRTKDREEVDEK
jgi:hypothetical protein